MYSRVDNELLTLPELDIEAFTTFGGVNGILTSGGALAPTVPAPEQFYSTNSPSPLL